MKHDSVVKLLEARFRAAMQVVLGQSGAELDPLIRPSGADQPGDYQSNAAMALAKRIKSSPKDVAERIAAAVELHDFAEPLQIHPKGFINIRLRDEFLARYLNDIPPPPSPGAAAPQARGAASSVGVVRRAVHDRMGMPPVECPQRVVVDYSSPNIAKEMHVGHLRSAIIGDVFARVLMFEGHDVIRQNHVGDWGTGIGKVILGLWYIESRRQRGEGIDAVRRRLDALPEKPPKKGATPEQIAAWSPGNRRGALAPICAQWSEDLGKPELDAFADADMSIAALELGYKFIEKLTTVAEGLGCEVATGPREGEDITELPRKVTRMLQEGGAGNSVERRAWQRGREISLRHAQEAYERLGLLLTPEDVCGESFYNDRLAPVVATLRKKLGTDGAETSSGVRVEMRADQGAECLFFYDARGKPAFKGPDGDELPLLIQKSDGAYLYATTDLAGFQYRIVERGARRLIYVTDGRQMQRFQMLFLAAQAAGWAGDDVSLEHVWFGSVLGEDGSPIKTRQGGVWKLRDLLDEAERRAAAFREDAKADGREAYEFSAQEKAEIARRVGVSAVKYFDLNRDRKKDYVFDWDHILTLKGNTAPAILYAHVRPAKIVRDALEQFPGLDLYAGGGAIRIQHPLERGLALRLARFRETIDAVASELAPHILCNYLYDLTGDANRFYEECPVLKADEATRLSRLRLCDLIARTTRLGLWLLGIETLDRM